MATRKPTLVEQKKDARRRQRERLALKEKDRLQEEEKGTSLLVQARKMFMPKEAVPEKPKAEREAERRPQRFKAGGEVSPRGQGKVMRSRKTRMC